MDKLIEKIIFKFPKTRGGTYLLVGFLSGLFLSNKPLSFIEINWLRYILAIIIVSYIFLLFVSASSKPLLKELENKSLDSNK